MVLEVAVSTLHVDSSVGLVPCLLTWQHTVRPSSPLQGQCSTLCNQAALFRDSTAHCVTKQPSSGIALLAPHGHRPRKGGVNKVCFTLAWLASRNQQASLPSHKKLRFSIVICSLLNKRCFCLISQRKPASFTRKNHTM